ncbi:trypsin-like peptidase domain-containing protein [archaeon]|nr:trypsin-like peptidase domain-containing protein [archaeon]
MNLKKLLAVGITSTTIASVAVTPEINAETPVYYNTSYDVNDNNLNKETLEYLLKTTQDIVVEVVFETHMLDLKTGERFFTGNASAYGGGSGVVLNKNGNRLDLLTCEHLNFQADFLYEPQWGNTVMTYNPISTKFYLVDKYKTDFSGKPKFEGAITLEFVKSDAQSDLMILRSKELSQEELSKYNTIDRVANESEVMQGDVVYTIGYPMDLGKQVTQGIISGLGNPNDPSDDGIFYVTSALNFGNSGGPNFVFKQGVPYIVGLSRLKFGAVNGIYGIVKPSLIKNFLTPPEQPKNQAQSPPPQYAPEKEFPWSK